MNTSSELEDEYNTSNDDEELLVDEISKKYNLLSISTNTNEVIPEVQEKESIYEKRIKVLENKIMKLEDVILGMSLSIGRISSDLLGINNKIEKLTRNNSKKELEVRKDNVENNDEIMVTLVRKDAFSKQKDGDRKSILDSVLRTRYTILSSVILSIIYDVHRRINTNVLNYSIINVNTMSSLISAISKCNNNSNSSIDIPELDSGFNKLLSNMLKRDTNIISDIISIGIIENILLINGPVATNLRSIISRVITRLINIRILLPEWIQYSLFKISIPLELDKNNKIMLNNSYTAGYINKMVDMKGFTIINNFNLNEKRTSIHLLMEMLCLDNSPKSLLSMYRILEPTVVASYNVRMSKRKEGNTIAS